LRHPLQLLAFALFAFATVAAAQTTVVQRENVRYEYAKVLRVTPVYQTLTATKTEVRCDTPTQEERSRIRRVVGAVRGAFQGQQERAKPTCRSVPVEREFRRPIAYDVHYTYRGSKYMSRLAEDPGHLLRIRISVMPAP
jgi:uncharacterized protein YcfJ